jgi:hypothetical protein
MYQNSGVRSDSPYTDIPTTKFVFAHVNLFAIPNNLHSCFIPFLAAFPYAENEQRIDFAEFEAAEGDTPLPLYLSYNCTDQRLGHLSFCPSLLCVSIRHFLIPHTSKRFLNNLFWAGSCADSFFFGPEKVRRPLSLCRYLAGVGIFQFRLNGTAVKWSDQKISILRISLPLLSRTLWIRSQK